MMVVKIKSKGNKSACHKKDKINNLEKKNWCGYSWVIHKKE